MTPETEIRSEAAMWAQGTSYTTDEIANLYRDYCAREQEAGREPGELSVFAERDLGIANSER